VRVHNRWSDGWRILITVLGWLAIVGGLVRLLFPARFALVVVGLAQNTGVIYLTALIFLAVGAFLSVKAYR
jgi:hypothetical protein